MGMRIDDEPDRLIADPCQRSHDLGVHLFIPGVDDQNTVGTGRHGDISAAAQLARFQRIDSVAE